MILLSLDTSVSCTGYSIFDVKDNYSFSILTYGKIPTEKKEFVYEDGIYYEDDRLNHICDIIEDLINEFEVTHICAENQFSGNNKQGALVLKKLIGGVMRTSKYHSITLDYYLPSQWRKVLGIKGKNKDEKKLATAELVRNELIDLGNLIQSGKKKNEDIYDSLAIGYAHIKKLKNNV